jgi:DNA-3-methyladenine glycosylase
LAGLLPDGPSLDARFFARDAQSLAQALIGVRVAVDGVGGIIVETEAYDATDPAARSYHGPTAHNAVLFGPPGRAQVYRIYGLHWCLNFVAGEAGSAVLIRAIEPLWGLETMAARRGGVVPRDLCSGPGRLCQALAVTGALDGAPLDQSPFALWDRESLPAIAIGKRVGITKNADVMWRYALSGSRFVSRPAIG